jgi:hypothetical protein
MKRATLAGIGLALVATVTLSLGGGPAAERAKAEPADPAGWTDEPTPPKMKFNGTAGCGAVGCHGAAVKYPPDPKSAYPYSPYAFTYWTNYDKHANAYNVLFNERSRRMMMNLLRYDSVEQTPRDAATKDARCLACHTIPESVLGDNGKVANTPDALTARTEGVSCEACHGLAEKWKGPHTAQAEWQTKTGPERRKLYDDTGMTWLNDLGVRAAVCAGCHVGAGPDPARHIPVRDVNHDLIAAGHPRLNFELLSYTQNQPPHWERKDRLAGNAAFTGKAGREYDARLWLVGQVANARAALGLLRYRARPARPSDPPYEGRTWAEFAEYDCFGCHHNLVSPSWRQLVGNYYTGSASKRRKPGSLVWCTWNVSKPLEQIADKTMAQAILDLRRAMASNYPNREAVTAQIDAFDTELKPLLKKVDTMPLPQAVVLLGQALPAEKEDFGGMNWDDAAQVYLAADALAHAAGLSDDPEVKAILAEIARALTMPRDGPIFFDSPIRFVPKPIPGVKQEGKDLPTLFTELRVKLLPN